MSLRASAHTGVAIRVPAVKLDKLALLRANSYTLSRIRLRRCSLLCAAAGDADCHVASLLAMTCKNLLRVRTARTHYRGKFATVYEFALSAAFSWRFLRGRGLPRRFAPRNDRGEVSSRPSALQPQTRFCLLHVIASHVLAHAHTSFLLHVIANQCAHWRGNPFSLR